MTTAIRSIIDIFRSAAHAARIADAVDNPRAPETRDLEALGVDPTEYRQIRRV